MAVWKEHKTVHCTAGECVQTQGHTCVYDVAQSALFFLLIFSMCCFSSIWTRKRDKVKADRVQLNNCAAVVPGPNAAFWIFSSTEPTVLPPQQNCVVFPLIVLSGAQQMLALCVWRVCVCQKERWCVSVWICFSMCEWYLHRHLNNSLSHFPRSIITQGRVHGCVSVICVCARVLV